MLKKRGTSLGEGTDYNSMPSSVGFNVCELVKSLLVIIKLTLLSKHSSGHPMMKSNRIANKSIKKKNHEGERSKKEGTVQERNLFCYGHVARIEQGMCERKI